MAYFVLPPWILVLQLFVAVIAIVGFYSQAVRLVANAEVTAPTSPFQQRYIKKMKLVQVWSALASGLLGHLFTTSWEALVPLLTSLSTPKLHSFVLRYAFQSSIHSLWTERNGRRHGEPPTPASTLAKLIDKNVRNRLSTLIMTGSPIYEGGLRYWFQSHSC